MTKREKILEEIKSFNLLEFSSFVWKCNPGFQQKYCIHNFFEGQEYDSENICNCGFWEGEYILRDICCFGVVELFKKHPEKRQEVIDYISKLDIEDFAIFMQRIKHDREKPPLRVFPCDWCVYYLDSKCQSVGYFEGCLNGMMNYFTSEV